MKLKKICKLGDNNFRRIVGVEPKTFGFLLNLLKPHWKKKRLAGGPIPKLKLEEQLLLCLNYLRNYGTYLETGTKFGVSESTAFMICRWTENILIKEKALHIPGKSALLKNPEQYKVIVPDVTECPIERPKRKKAVRRKNKQRQFYSGKKKRHTAKEQIIVDQKTGKIISTSYAKGKTHDYKIYKKSKTRVHKNTKIQADSGYQGIQKIHPNSEIPKKRSKKHPLTSEDKKRNKEISSSRVIVENVFAFLKKFKIISQRYRNRRKRFGLRFNLICGIFNYEWNQES